jgi:hypothetical protein
MFPLAFPLGEHVGTVVVEVGVLLARDASVDASRIQELVSDFRHDHQFLQGG